MTTLTLTFEGPAEDAALKLLLKDALGEFASRRTPATAYVDARYPYLPYVIYASKVAEVINRIGLAYIPKAAVDDAAIERTVTP